MKKLKLLLLICLLYANNTISQNTYTWAVDSGNFLAPNSWIPARNNPAENDVLVFDGNIKSMAWVNNLRTQTIGRLLIKNNANVTFNSAILDTGIGNIKRLYLENSTSGSRLNNFRQYDVLIDTFSSSNPDNNTNFIHKRGQEISNLINDSTFNFYSSYSSEYDIPFYRIPKLVISYKSSVIPSFEIEQGAILSLNYQSIVFNILFDSGTNAIISGVLRINRENPPTLYLPLPKISAMDSLCIKVKPTGKVLLDKNTGSITFGNSGMPNIIVFESGSTLEQRSGHGVHGNFSYDNQIGALTKIKFLSGSNYIFTGYNTFISGVNMGNFIYKCDTFKFPYPLSILIPSSIENLQVDSGSLMLVISNVLNIKGNIIVNAPGELIINATNNNAIINLISNSTQTITGNGKITVLSDNNQPINLNLKNPNGLSLQRNLDLGNCKLSLDSSFINLNGYNLSIGQDSLNYGNLKVSKSYITGNGSLTRWYPSNNAVTNNLDTTLFPFGTNTQNRSFWVSGNITQAGTLTVSHNNNAGYTLFPYPFNDSLSNSLLVNARQNYNWQVIKSTSLKGQNLTIKAQGQLDTNYINIPANVRLTLSNGKAPGSFVAGSLFNNIPLSTRQNLTDSVLNNTFYLGANSNYCLEPDPPQALSTSICYGTKALLKANGKGKISWFSDSIGGTRLKNDSVYNTLSLIQTTYYYIQDSTCAKSKLSNLKVYVLSKPYLTINVKDTGICQGQTITLSGNGAKTYNWNNNVINNEPFKPLVNNNYKLIGIDSNGCIDSAFISIVVNANPTVNILASQNPVCAKTPVKLTATGGNLYFWTDGIINGELFVPLNSKTYSVTVLNEKGCSDTASIKLDVKPLPNVAITKNKTILTATQTEANYQWLNCNTNSIIANANAQNYTAKVNGNYAVIVNQLGCKDTSVCVNINSVGILENETLAFKVYPNPANNKLNITTSSNIKSVLIYDVTGKLVKKLNLEIDNLKDVSLAIDDLAQGLYIIEIIDELDTKKTSRFIKE